jgi:hypothetical protein
MSVTQKSALLFKTNNFPSFVNKLQDLTQISDVIKLKIDSEHILAYAMITNDVSVMALKNYLLITNDYIDGFKSDKVFDLVITSAAKFVKNLKFFTIDYIIKFDLEAKVNPDDETTFHIRSCRFHNSKFKVSCIGGELHKIRDINKLALKSRTNPKNSKWGFKISKSDLQDVKKLCNINSEDKVLTVIVQGGSVKFSEELKWELEVDKIEDQKNRRIVFNKKYLSNIDDENELIEFKIFETFILVTSENSNLILSFETDFNTDD